jgi:2'-5' RNA ligase
VIRLFAAVAVPEAAAEVLAPLAEGVPGARWSPPENLHVTLRFAG